MREAKLRQTETGLVPDSAGWFVLNLRDASWDSMGGRGAWTAWEAHVPAYHTGARL